MGSVVFLIFFFYFIIKGCQKVLLLCRPDLITQAELFLNEGGGVGVLSLYSTFLRC